MRTTSTIRLLATAALALGLTACSSDEPATPEPTGPTTVAPTPSQTPEPSETPEPSQTPEPSETTEPAPPPTEDAEPSAADVDGRWCPTPESPASPGCVSIELPNATYDDGTVVDITAHGSPTEAEGGFSFSMADAPFGTYYPASAAIPGGTPDYYPGADLPEEDRIWNGQTGTMLVRDES